VTEGKIQLNPACELRSACPTVFMVPTALGPDAIRVSGPDQKLLRLASVVFWELTARVEVVAPRYCGLFHTLGVVFAALTRVGP
jgi:hypothetical protein